LSEARQLPPCWVEVRLDEVCAVNVRCFSVLPHSSELPATFVPMSAVIEEFGGIDVSAARPLSEVSKGYTSFVEGDVLFAKITPCMENGKVALVPPLPHHVGFGSTEFHVVRSEGAVEPKWVAYYLSQLEFRRAARQDMTGSAGQLRVQSGWLAGASLPIAPLAEQQRILLRLDEVLSELDEGVAELLTAQKKLTQYRQSLLKAAVEGDLTAEWRAKNPPQETGAALLAGILRERRTRWEARQLEKFAEAGKSPPRDWQSKYEEPISAEPSSRIDLPTTWSWATMDQVTSSQRYGTSAKTSGNAGGVPVLRMGNIQNGALEFDSLKFLPVEHPEFPALFLQDGELLFNRTNSPELVGKTAVFRSERSPCSFASYLIGVSLVDECKPEFASAFINSLHGRNWVASVVTQQVGQANVNGSKLAALAIPLPPLDEQRVILEVFEEQSSALAAQVFAVEQSLRMAAAQRQNILRAAFSGQLVPQDPNDEPASALLARIRAQRGVAAPNPPPAPRHQGQRMSAPGRSQALIPERAAQRVVQ
jgi:type I restriction enzyme S subunit